MRVRLVPALAVTYYVAMLVAVTYPGYVPFDRIRPFVFGMPFSLFWQALWISGCILVLAGLFWWERRRASAPASDAERRGATTEADD
jgi:hypothetical protein